MKYSRVARECRQNRGTRGTLRISPLYERGRKMTRSRCIVPKFSALIKYKSETQISPHSIHNSQFDLNTFDGINEMIDSRGLSIV